MAAMWRGSMWPQPSSFFSVTFEYLDARNQEPCLSTQSESPPQTRTVSNQIGLASVSYWIDLFYNGSTRGKNVLQKYCQDPPSKLVRTSNILIARLSYPASKSNLERKFFSNLLLRGPCSGLRAVLYVRPYFHTSQESAQQQISLQLLQLLLQSFRSGVTPMGESRMHLSIFMHFEYFIANFIVMYAPKEWPIKQIFLCLQCSITRARPSSKNCQMPMLSIFVSSGQDSFLLFKPIPLISHKTMLPFARRRRKSGKYMQEVPPNPCPKQNTLSFWRWPINIVLMTSPPATDIYWTWQLSSRSRWRKISSSSLLTSQS